jgi:hypothetical protein
MTKYRISSLSIRLPRTPPLIYPTIKSVMSSGIFVSRQNRNLNQFMTQKPASAAANSLSSTTWTTSQSSNNKVVVTTCSLHLGRGHCLHNNRILMTYTRLQVDHKKEVPVKEHSGGNKELKIFSIEAVMLWVAL